MGDELRGGGWDYIQDGKNEGMDKGKIIEEGYRRDL